VPAFVKRNQGIKVVSLCADDTSKELPQVDPGRRRALLAEAMTQMITSGTFVICGECGSTIYAGDPESLVEMEEDKVWLRCHNNCCGQVSSYTASDLITPATGNTIDYTSRIFLEG
jgi:hypothetical protein